jgi:hypothetical protein
MHRSQSIHSRRPVGALAVGNNDNIFLDYYYTFFPPERVAGRALSARTLLVAVVDLFV